LQSEPCSRLPSACVRDGIYLGIRRKRRERLIQGIAMAGLVALGPIALWTERQIGWAARQGPVGHRLDSAGAPVRAAHEPEQQLAALKAAGGNEVLVDKASGASRELPQLARALAGVKAWRRAGPLEAGPSGALALALFEDLEAVGVGFKSLTEAIDTATPAGRLMSQIMGALAEFERALISECTKAGLAGARANGRIGGRRQSHAHDRGSHAGVPCRRS
jgi:hypothetical protein